jgi:hypothetical protein
MVYSSPFPRSGWAPKVWAQQAHHINAGGYGRKGMGGWQWRKGGLRTVGIGTGMGLVMVSWVGRTEDFSISFTPRREACGRKFADGSLRTESCGRKFADGSLRTESCGRKFADRFIRKKNFFQYTIGEGGVGKIVLYRQEPTPIMR